MQTPFYNLQIIGTYRLNIENSKHLINLANFKSIKIKIKFFLAKIAVNITQTNYANYNRSLTMFESV